MTYRHGLLALAAGILVSGAALAHPAETGVSIIRGIDQNASATAGVTIIRGEPGPRPQPRPVLQSAPGRIVAAGEDFWIYDAANDRLTACDFTRGTNVGSRRIRCFTRHLPQ